MLTLKLHQPQHRNRSIVFQVAVVSCLGFFQFIAIHKKKVSQDLEKYEIVTC